MLGQFLKQCQVGNHSKGPPTRRSYYLPRLRAFDFVASECYRYITHIYSFKKTDNIQLFEANNMSSHWRTGEEIRYHFFLVLTLHGFLGIPRRQHRFFKAMSEFVGAKSPDQCRSHHQKRLKGGSVQSVLNSFYIDYYQARFIPAAHSLLQFQLILQQNQDVIQSLNSFFRQQYSEKDYSQSFFDNWLQIAKEGRARREVSTQTVELREQETQTVFAMKGANG